jgi:hypothetical protein
MKHHAAVALVCAFATPAFAEPGGVSSVSGPTVHEGRTTLEARTAAYDGGALDGAWAHRVQASHGVTEWYQGALILRASQPDGESAELRSVAIENRIDLIPTREWPVHFALQGEYKFGLRGADDEVEFKLLAEHETGPFTARLNLVADRALEDDAEWEHGYGVQAMWDASDSIALGFEAYGELDADAHAIGPRASFKFGDASLAVTYLTGLDEAQADGQFRVTLGWTP